MEGKRTRESRERRSSRNADEPGSITNSEPRVWKNFQLSPFQVQAVEAIEAGENVLVGAPTGAGKTLVAEYAIEDAVRRGKRCVYTAPIKALSNQKFRDFRDDPTIDVGLLTGDVTIRPNAQVLIMTTEILRNAIFDNPEYLNDVEFAIFDEMHFLDDLERGSVWEECLIFAPPSIRFICLSATISNMEELGGWLEEIRERKISVVTSEHRPVPLSYQLFTPRSGTFEPEKIGRVRKREESAPPKRIKSRHPGGGRARGRRKQADERWRKKKEDEQAPDLSRLIDDLAEDGLLPALVFAFSRKDCERLALRHTRRELLKPAERKAMRAFQDELMELFDLPDGFLDGSLMSMARRGIAYHHAGMLPVHKEIVERMFTSGLVKLLFTTETFAVGINMPARCVIFHSLRKFDGVSFDYLRTRDFLQMAGRAGRQGIDEDGLVFCSLSRKDLREAPLDRVMSGTPESVKSRFRLSYSTILHLVAGLGRDRIPEAWEKSLNQYQHRDDSRKSRDRNRRKQNRVIDAHLAVLDQLGYLDGDELTPRGRFARRINGYELQMTELVFHGALEHLGTEALALIFVAHIFEERRRGEQSYVPARMYGGMRKQVTQIVRQAAFLAIDCGIPTPVKIPDWGLTPVTLDWMRGATMDEIAERTDATPGDICRTFRMALQLVRQVRRAIDPEWDLYERLGDVMLALNRDEVDARKQLEMG